MTTIRRSTVDNSIEEQITTAMIMSDSFLSDIVPIFNKEYMQNSFARIVCYWCADHFNKFKKSPKMHIKDIFLMESEAGLPIEDREIIQTFLSKLNEQYMEGQGINAEYIKDNAFQYFRKRELQIRTKQASSFLDLGNIEKAEEQFSAYKKVAFLTSGWFNPFDSKEILEVFDERDEDVFVLPGALGQILGRVERGWFIAVLAPFKRGKSWFLQEMAVRALFQRFKVVFISLEMNPKSLKERLYKRLTGFGSKSGEDTFLYPVFDCELNQLGACDRPERTNSVRLLGPDGIKPDYNLDLEYRPCTYCRDNFLRDYRAASWFEPIEVPQFSYQETRKFINGVKQMYGDNLRFIRYPRFMAGISDIKRDLMILEQHEGFIPDVIIIDYADILKMAGKDKRNEIDDIWKMIASLASERHCITFTASQGTRGSIYKRDLSQDDIAEWIGKLGHVDALLGLNQTSLEKQSKVIRVNLLVHRHKESDETASALLLQQLEVGQFAMDSHLTRRRVDS